MIEPNWNLFMWYLLILSVVSCILHIVFGVAELEKDKNYSIGNAILGFIFLMILIVIIIL